MKQVVLLALKALGARTVLTVGKIGATQNAGARGIQKIADGTRSADRRGRAREAGVGASRARRRRVEVAHLATEAATRRVAAGARGDTHLAQAVAGVYGVPELAAQAVRGVQAAVAARNLVPALETLSAR